MTDYQKGYQDGYKDAKEERTQGVWIPSGVDISGHRLNRCSICNGVYQMSYVGDPLSRWNFCPNCGADMRKPNCVTCDHFGKCDGCEKGEEE
jgi:hypothetical protein